MCPKNTILIILAQKSDNCFTKCFLIVALLKSFLLEKLKQATTLPMVRHLIFNSVLQSDHIVAYFDESVNEVVQKGQMDLCVSYWDVNKSQAATRYFDSSFSDMPLLTISSQVSLVY